jgi:rhodanese-related sulfurtransferase
LKNILFFIFFISTILFANSKSINVTPKLVNSGIKIIDIRTQSEWIETGIVAKSILITFFDDNGKYNVKKFLQALNKHIDINETFAIICRTGNRTTSVSDFLGKNGYSVINLKGGIKSLEKQGYILVNYKEKN